MATLGCNFNINFDQTLAPGSSLCNTLRTKLHASAESSIIVEQKHITPKRITLSQSSGILLISQIVARNLYRDYRDVNDVVQKAFTVLMQGNILRKT